MTGSDSKNDRAGAGNRKDVIIAALATILAAAITASATLIAASRRAKVEVEQDLDVVRVQLVAARTQNQQLREEVEVRDKRISALEESSTRASRMEGVAQPNATPSEHPTRRAAGYEIALVGCHRDAGTVACGVTVTNQDVEREFRLIAADFYHFTSRAFDESHRVVLGKSAELGGGSGWQPGVVIPAGETVNGAVFFEVPTTTQLFTTLEILFDSPHGVQYKIIFKNVQFKS